MSDKTTVSRGELWGVKVAHKTKWLIKKLKAFDKSCVARAKSKNTPGWLGHIPLVSITLAVIALLAYFSLYILFAFGALVILFSVIEHFDISSENSIQFSDNDSDDNNSEWQSNLVGNSDDFRNGNQGFGYYMNGINIDED
ncbi:TPA: DUF3742 family protein [Proteus mirabilis]|nr:DUF3742 family protein [Proteus mirabilis]